MQAGQTRRPTRWGPMTITWCLHQTKCIGLEEAWVDKFCPDMLESKQTSFGCSNRNYVEKDENLDLPEGISQTKGRHSSQRDFQRTTLIDWFLYGPLLVCKWLRIANYNIRRWKFFGKTAEKKVLTQLGVWMLTLSRVAPPDDFLYAARQQISRAVPGWIMNTASAQIQNIEHTLHRHFWLLWAKFCFMHEFESVNDYHWIHCKSLQSKCTKHNLKGIQPWAWALEKSLTRPSFFLYFPWAALGETTDRGRIPRSSSDPALAAGQGGLRLWANPAGRLSLTGIRLHQRADPHLQT